MMLMTLMSIRYTYVHPLENSAQLVGCQSVLVQSVVPVDPLQDFEVATTQPVSTLKNHLCTTRPAPSHLTRSQPYA